MIEMAMSNDNCAEIGSIKSDQLELTRKLKAAAGVDKERRAASSGNNHASHRPIRMKGAPVSRRLISTSRNPNTLFQFGWLTSGVDAQGHRVLPLTISHPNDTGLSAQPI